MMKALFITLCILSLTPNLYSQSSEIKILKHKQKIQIEELTLLNSRSRETNLSISPDGKYLFFMTDRGGMPWSRTGFGTYKGKPRFDGDIWYSQKKFGEWTAAKALGRNVNTSSGEDEPNISPDGQIVVYQSWAGDWARRGGPYFQAQLSNNIWSKPEPLGSGINQFFASKRSAFGGNLATDGVAVSPNQKTFIVAFGPDYDGNMDLFWSKKKDGKWSFLEKLPISTPKDERSVFLAGDGKTLFFASNGYKGLGGLDIYQTTLNEDGSHGPIVNLGAPFNSPKDDYGFIITASGEEAYFVREGDIFYANLRDADISFKPSPTMIISGNIGNKIKIKEDMTLHLKDPIKNDVISQSKISYTGTYSFAIPERTGTLKIQNAPNSSFIMDTMIIVKKTGKYQELSLPNLTYKEIKKPIVELGPTRSSIPIRIIKHRSFGIDIHFDFDQTILAPKFRRQLDTMYEEVKNQPGYLIKITGHTDDKGGNGYNRSLGLRRAKTVKNYLQYIGVPAEAIKIATNGETKPISDNDSEEGTYQNRRVELQITY